MKKLHTQKAFTLVEMIVALGIFSIVAVVALGALVKILSVNQKAQTLHQAMTNLNFSLESISRELRTGASLHCESGSTLNIPGWQLSSTLACDVSGGPGYG
ncbi:MAG: type II secretion system protein, partial [Patescibacteria group bacterium]